MDLGAPFAEGTMTITSVTIGKNESTFNCEGTVGKYGSGFATMQLRASDDSRATYETEGSARALMEDGTMVSGSLRGVGRRDEGKLKLFSVDNTNNGDQNLSVWEVDILNKSASLKVYALR